MAARPRACIEAPLAGDSPPLTGNERIRGSAAPTIGMEARTMSEKADAPTTGSRAAQFLWGVALMILGSALILERLGFWDFRWRDVWRQWPLPLIAMGLARLLWPARKDGRRGGLWLMFVGVLGLAHTQRVLHLRDSWPLFLVAVGAGIAAETLRRRKPDDVAGAPHGE